MKILIKGGRLVDPASGRDEVTDIAIAGDAARFGQPEITLGWMPGAGGTQRLSKTAGKYRAMELILTGRQFDAAEAMRIGLVNRVLPVETYFSEAMALAKQIDKVYPYMRPRDRKSVV